MSSARQIGRYIEAQVSQDKTMIYFRDIREALIAPDEQQDDNEFTRALDKYGSEVTKVVIRNVPDFKNTRCISKLRKHLPKLKSMTISGNFPPETGDIIIEELKKCLSQGIRLSLHSSLEIPLMFDLCQYLVTNGQAKSAKLTGLSLESMRDDEFNRLVQAYNSAIEYANGSCIEANAKLLSDYHSGEGFDKSSPWFAKGPKRDLNYPESADSLEMVTLYALITKLNLWSTLAGDKRAEAKTLFAQSQQLQAAFHDPAVLALQLPPEKIVKYMNVLRAMALVGSYEDYQKIVQPTSLARTRI